MRCSPDFKDRFGAFRLNLLGKPGSARGPRARSYIEAFSSKLRTRAACAPRRFHRFRASFGELLNNSSENLGQDAILSHEFSSFQGEFSELLNNSSGDWF